MSAKDIEFVEPERYELREALPWRFEPDRREFVQLAGAGLLLSVLAPRSQALVARAPADSIAERLHIGADGVVTVLTSKVEVGQGSRTELAAAAAEELEIPLARVALVMADTAVVPDDGGTSGSQTTPSTVPRVRTACRAARELLARTAAKEWGVEASSLAMREGMLVEPSSDRAMGYADLASREVGGELEREVSSAVRVVRVEDWRILGTHVPKVGARDVVTGAHRHPSDVVLPGMLRGVVLRGPFPGATLSSVDLEAAQGLEGVSLVRDGDFVGFAARTSAAARSARDAVAATAKWEVPSAPSSEELYDHLASHAREGEGRRGGPRVKGTPDEAFASATRVERAQYRVAYVQHAPLEPRAAVAQWTDGGLTVWTGTQQPGRVRESLAETFRIPRERVRVIVPDTGGGFGGKHTGEAAVEAARLARAAEKPVCVRWSREEEFTFAYFRPAGVVDLAGALDADGKLVAWEQVNVNSGASALEMPYDVPHVRTAFRESDAPLRQGSYRALAATANVFARESFLDELATAAGTDPLSFRMERLSDERLGAVLETVAERYEELRDRGATKGDLIRGAGIACGTEKGSYVAACVEVEIDRAANRYRVVQILQAFECGAILNPRNLEAQVQGCIIQGLGALKEEVRFAEGRMLNPRFSSYPVPRQTDVPKIEVVLLDRPDLPSAGAGETPIVAVAPAIANAIFAACGTRIRALPLRDESLRAI
jgi:isoquinoline 1-oxidoreductase